MGGTTGFGFSWTQAASALMSIARNCGGVPSNVTVPVIVPAVAGSMTAVGSGGSEEFSLSFLLQPVIANPRIIANAKTAGRIFKRRKSFLLQRLILTRARTVCHRARKRTLESIQARL